MPEKAIKLFRFVSLAAFMAVAVGPPIAEAQQQGQQQQQPQKLVPEATYGDWAKACQDAPSGGGRECFVFQNAPQGEGTRQILNMTMLRVPQAKGPIMILTVPIGVWLPRGLAISIDGAKPIRVPLQICAPRGCQSQFEMPDDLVNSFKAGLKGNVQMFDPAGKEVNVPFSLNGFTAALGSLS
jgi:invasion protein IalB